MLSFQEVEVESVLPFQDLGANFTFCCVAVNREGNTSDVLHSVFSKIPTCSIVEWGTVWLLGTCLCVFPYCLGREVWSRFPRPSVLTGGGRLWHLLLLHALWELLAGQSPVPKAEPCRESFLTAAAQPAVAQLAGVQESHLLLGLCRGFGPDAARPAPLLFWCCLYRRRHAGGGTGEPLGFVSRTRLGFQQLFWVSLRLVLHCIACMGSLSEQLSKMFPEMGH